LESFLNLGIFSIFFTSVNSTNFAIGGGGGGNFHQILDIKNWQKKKKKKLWDQTCMQQAAEQITK
jgi:hypothetical protein